MVCMRARKLRVRGLPFKVLFTRKRRVVTIPVQTSNMKHVYPLNIKSTSYFTCIDSNYIAINDFYGDQVQVLVPKPLKNT